MSYLRLREDCIHKVDQTLRTLPVDSIEDFAVIKEALLTITDPSFITPVDISLSGRVKKLAKILSHPEKYGETLAEQHEFKEVILSKVAAKIAELDSFSPSEKEQYIKDQRFIREQEKAFRRSILDEFDFMVEGLDAQHKHASSINSFHNMPDSEGRNTDGFRLALVSLSEKLLSEKLAHQNAIYGSLPEEDAKSSQLQTRIDRIEHNLSLINGRPTQLSPEQRETLFEIMNSDEHLVRVLELPFERRNGAPWNLFTYNDRMSPSAADAAGMPQQGFTGTPWNREPHSSESPFLTELFARASQTNVGGAANRNTSSILDSVHTAHFPDQIRVVDYTAEQTVESAIEQEVSLGDPTQSDVRAASE